MAGFLVAIASTATRAAGGKAPRATRARRLVQALEPVRQRALTPTADGMPLTGHRGGHLPMRWVLWRGSPEEEPTAKGQGLGGGMGSHKRRSLGGYISAEGHRARKRHGHGQGPYRGEGTSEHGTNIPIILHLVSPQIYWHRIYEMDI